jgi:hypothetical protein
MPWETTIFVLGKKKSIYFRQKELSISESPTGYRVDWDLQSLPGFLCGGPVASPLKDTITNFQALEFRIVLHPESESYLVTNTSTYRPDYGC